MYRIIFVAKRGKWVIKIAHTFGLFWNTVCGDDKKPLTFDDYTAAQEKVIALGLDNVYKNFHNTAVSQIMRSVPQNEHGYEPVGARMRNDVEFQRNRGIVHNGHDNMPHSTMRHDHHLNATTQ